jgi:DNA polymerase-3 subunit delta
MAGITISVGGEGLYDRMRNYSAMKVMQIISKIREIDAKSKGLDNPNTPPGELMKELIFYIFH